MSQYVPELGSMLLWAQSAELETIPWLRWALWMGIGFFVVFPGIVAYMVWAERKVAARFQDRIGPNRVGPLGLLQPIADAIKLVTKESIVPRAADSVVHLLAPLVLLVSSFLVLAVIPFGVGLAPVNLPTGLLYFIAASGLASLGVFLAGWASRNKYSLLGSMRGVAQLVSYEIPQVLATIPVALWAGSLSMVAIVESQVEHGWFLLSPPGLLGFLVLTIASIAEVNRAPFDLPEAESELIAGYHTEYSGMRFGLFFLAEYMAIFAVSCLGTVIYLGGSTLPPPLSHIPQEFVPIDTWLGFLLVNAVAVPVFALKVLLMIFLIFWVRATLPRMRVDRLMNFAWKVLVPLSLGTVLVAAVWLEIVIRPIPNFVSVLFLDFNLNILYGWLVTLPLVLVLVAVVVWVNRREYPEPPPAVAPVPVASPATSATVTAR